MSRGDVIGGASVPLSDALPWSSNDGPRTFVVNDSMGADGRFLLYTWASQVLAGIHYRSVTGSNLGNHGTHDAKPGRGRVLWLACGPVTERHILQGLKKIGCDKGVLSQAVLSGNDSDINGKDTTQSSLTIRSLVTELSSILHPSQTTMNNQNNHTQFSENDFVQQIYHFVTEAWLPSSSKSSLNAEPSNNWIILDDVSSLANLLGEKLIYRLILALNSNKSHDNKNGNSFGILMRCSNDFEAESLPTLAGSSISSSGTELFGAGGNSGTQNHNSSNYIPWERSLVEIADGVMDLLPLKSGYTRELHGRIVATQMPQGRGWGEFSNKNTANINNLFSRQQKQQVRQLVVPTQSINYCIMDQKIVAYKI